MNVFFDYTCPYSYRALPWIEAVVRGGVDVSWRTFSLKEANRDRDSASPFDDPEISSISVVALALAQAAKEAEFDHYHRSVFNAIHDDGRRLDERELLALAAAAGVDVARFERERRRWLAAVAQDHPGRRPLRRVRDAHAGARRGGGGVRQARQHPAGGTGARPVGRVSAPSPSASRSLSRSSARSLWRQRPVLSEPEDHERARAARWC